MIGTRTSSSYTPHVDVDPADRPLILVAPRWEEAKPYLSETLSPNEEIASVFVDAILAAGGLPLQMSITEDIEVIRHYVEIADGVAIPGGPDVNPKRWGDERPYDPTLCCEIRDRFEFKLVNEVLRAKKPLFTTCRGTQLLNVATGGTCAWTCRAWVRARVARSGVTPTCSTIPCTPSRSCRARCWNARLAGTG